MSGLEPDPIIAPLLADAEMPDVVPVTAYVGREQEGMVRLYRDLSLKVHIDVPRELIHKRYAVTDGPSVLWLNSEGLAEAHSEDTITSRIKPDAFLRGSIASGQLLPRNYYESLDRLTFFDTAECCSLKASYKTRCFVVDIEI